MKKILLKTTCKKMLADLFTPVSIYLRVRDRFRDTVLLESTDHHVSENSFSFICINAIAGMEVSSTSSIEFKLPGNRPERITIADPGQAPDLLWDFMQRFEIEECVKEATYAQGLFGYTTFDAVQFFDSVKFSEKKEAGEAGNSAIPLMRYRLYQYVIAINHFKDELFICENVTKGIDSEIEVVEGLIKSRDVPVFPFKAAGSESSNMADDQYMDSVKNGIQSCMRGDVFQIVLSRRFQRTFTGDEFNVYRALRSINPSPYLFYFDYGDYKLIGSSPESQLIVGKGKAIVHPIAGTVRRTGDDATDQQLAEQLQADPKENAEHVMLVDLARNDLSRICDQVMVDSYRKVHYYSHVIHLVSEVTGRVRPGSNPFRLMASTFPAGTLSGAPKFKALQLIDSFEPTSRSYYGGAIGFMGFDGSCNHAIMIRTFMSKNNTLFYQAGAGVVAASKPENELQEVNNKLNALKNAIELAQTI